MEPFDGLAVALASLMGATPEAAGWILGLAFVGIMTFAVMLFMDKSEMNVGFLFAGLFASFAVGVEWFPVWVVIFIALFVILAIMDPFGD